MSALSAAVLASTALAQVDPFAVAAPPRPPGAPAAGPVSSPLATPAYASGGAGARTGFIGVDQAVGASYSAAQPKGYASSAQIKALPKSVAPMPVRLKASNARYLKDKPKIAVPTYAVAIIRSGSMRASSAGQGSDITPRATKIDTVLTGVDDAMAQKIADDANADLMSQLSAAGFEVVPQAEVQAAPNVQRIALAGDKVKGQNDWFVYGAKAAPLRSGHPWSRAVLAASGASIALTDASVDLDAVMLIPSLAIDYQRFESSGNRTYSGSAYVSQETRFRIAGGGASFIYGKQKGKGSGWGGSLNCEPSGTDELFGVLYEINDKSDDVGLHNTFAELGLGSIYRQSKYYAVEAVPERYAALARAAYQGFNAALVAEIKKARGA